MFCLTRVHRTGRERPWVRRARVFSYPLPALPFKQWALDRLQMGVPYMS